jgi:hypothetical protein
MSMLWRLSAIAGLLSAVAADAQDRAAPGAPVLATSVAAYNRLDTTGTNLAIARFDVPEDDNWDPDGGQLPAWLGALDLTEQEADALVAVVGAYGVDQDAYPSEKRRPKAIDYLAGMAMSVVADNLERRAERRPNSNTEVNPVRWPQTRRFPAGPARSRWPDQETRLAESLVKLDSCAGAFVSAVDKVLTAKPDAAFTIFAQAVLDDLPLSARRKDATCSRRD